MEANSGAANSGAVEDSPQQRLQSYLRSAGRDWNVTDWAPLDGGRSSTSIKARIDDGTEALDVVVHLQPASGPLVGISDPSRQFKLLGSLQQTSLPTPRALWELPEHVLGRPGFVTDFTAGDAPDPWRRNGREYLETRRCWLVDVVIGTLAELHAVPLDHLPPGLLDGPEFAATFASREHSRWSRILHRSDAFRDDPVYAYADAWLAAHTVEEPTRGLIHGDYRIGNLVFGDRSLRSILDWELFDVGDPLYDLATLCSPALRIDGRAGALADRAELVRSYEKASGRPVDASRLDYLAVLATFKVGCLWVAAAYPFELGAGDLPAIRAGFSAADVRPMLAEALDIEVPTVGQVDDPALTGAADEIRRVAASLPAGDERDRLGMVNAVLAAIRKRPATVPSREVARDIVRLADRVGIEVVDAGESAQLWPALARAARALLADPEFAASPAEGDHLRLRRAVGEAAASASVGWNQPTVDCPGSDHSSNDDTETP